MRVHYVQFLCNEEGQPIENAEIYFLIKDGTNSDVDDAAYYFTRSDGGTAQKSYEGNANLTTNSDGRFEFWVGDVNDGKYGYNWITTFKVAWKTTTYENNINEVTIFPIIESVDETNAFDTIKDKVTSNYLMANTWLAATKGFFQRPQFEWKDVDKIYINPAKYHLDGTTERVVYWDSQLIFQFGSLGSNEDSEDLANSTWFYVYIDDSAVTSLNDNEITATQLVARTNGPTYDPTKHGWYNDSIPNDRCIFAVLTDSSAEILEFWHDGYDLIHHAVQIEERAEATLADTNWHDIDIGTSIPSFSQEANIYFVTEWVDASTSLYYRVNGTSSSGIEIGAIDTNARIASPTVRTLTDSAQIMEVKHSTAGQNLTINTNGWYLPIGM